ncbi:RCC1 repeat-containing protein [Teratosphaeria destructans]|uniref:RCC1 repeat-containing protein n=1 Tax=Teratosphaeria destructans TaxID=418781 RepID=A0A9W7W692_9PEZI|nr:RCC1 repeat-containing protein [Teratosphaeria destructans]
MTLLALGSNGSGQLGVGHNEDLCTPGKCQLVQHITFSGIKQVVAGGNHTLVLLHSGQVEVFGSNEHHECAAYQTGDSSVTSEPPFNSTRDDLGPRTIAQVAANWTASTYLDHAGAIATCGEGLSGELGQGRDVSTSATPGFIKGFAPGHERVVQIASSMAHTVAVLGNGEIWGWGKGRKGQLGAPAQDAWTPRKIEVGFPVVKAVCGKDFTFVAGDAIEGRVALIGADGRDRFKLKSSVPDNLPGWKEIAASWGSVFILFDDGRLVGYGRDDHGQLPPFGLPPVAQVAAGSEHCIALTRDGRVLAWGWGEHGNCGERTDDNRDVKGKWNKIEVAGRPIDVFAGCATSFIVTAT